MTGTPYVMTLTGPDINTEIILSTMNLAIAISVLQGLKEKLEKDETSQRLNEDITSRATGLLQPPKPAQTSRKR